jgi:hypothetical protein
VLNVSRAYASPFPRACEGRGGGGGGEGREEGAQGGSRCVLSSVLATSLDNLGGDIEEGEEMYDEEMYDEEGVAREVWPLLSALRACGGGEGGRDGGREGGRGRTGGLRREWGLERF